MPPMVTAPTPEYVRQRLPGFEAEPRVRDAELAVALVFSQHPLNTQVDAVLAKVAILNSLYSTSIYGLHAVAEHIVALDIDAHLVAGDVGVVDRIAQVTIGGRPRNVLSFATKYCSWHQPDRYQICDSLVENLLWQYRKQFEFARFKRQEMRTYARFVQIVDAMVEHFGLHAFSRKDLDKFMWLEGRTLARSQAPAGNG